MGENKATCQQDCEEHEGRRSLSVQVEVDSAATSLPKIPHTFPPPTASESCGINITPQDRPAFSKIHAHSALEESPGGAQVWRPQQASIPSLIRSARHSGAYLRRVMTIMTHVAACGEHFPSR